MNIRKLTELSARLEKTVGASLDERSTPQEKYELYEEVAIQILDSEFMEYAVGELEGHLMMYLERKRLSFGLKLK
jgi:hypothetical protein